MFHSHLNRNNHSKQKFIHSFALIRSFEFESNTLEFILVGGQSCAMNLYAAYFRMLLKYCRFQTASEHLYLVGF